MIDDQDPVEQKARQLRAAGVPLAEIERYVASKRGGGATAMSYRPEHSKFTSAQLTARADRSVAQSQEELAAEPGYGERLATHLLNAGQGIPGVERLEANAGALTSGLSSDEALAQLRERTGQIGGVTKMVEQGLGGLAVLPFLPANPTLAGALYGGAQGLGAADSMSGAERATRTGVGALLGGGLGYAGGWVGDKIGLTRPTLARWLEQANASRAGDALRSLVGAAPLRPPVTPTQSAIETVMQRMPVASTTPAASLLPELVALPSVAPSVAVERPAAQSVLAQMLESNHPFVTPEEFVKGYPISGDPPPASAETLRRLEEGLLRLKRTRP